MGNQNKTSARLRPSPWTIWIYVGRQPGFHGWDTLVNLRICGSQKGSHPKRKNNRKQPPIFLGHLG